MVYPQAFVPPAGRRSDRERARGEEAGPAVDREREGAPQPQPQPQPPRHVKPEPDSGSDGEASPRPPA
eukprot:tig00000870_g5145.t1